MYTDPWEPVDVDRSAGREPPKGRSTEAMLPTSPVSPVPTERQLTDPLELSVVLPCLNEEATIGLCIEQISRTLEAQNISGEIIVADNGSSDRSREIALAMGAHVVIVENRGYGSALMGGINAARG